MKNLEHYISIASLFDYPGRDFSRNVSGVQSMLHRSYPEAALELKDFSFFASYTGLTEQQEIYTRTFDVQAITTLDLGYVLFGDDYKRGELLSNLNREYFSAGAELNGQLSDHLPNLLRLLPKIKDMEFLNELVRHIISPAVRSIITEFDTDRISSKNQLYEKHHNTLIETSDKYALCYEHALRSLYLVLKTDFDENNISLPGKSSGFLGSIADEIKLEQLK